MKALRILWLAVAFVVLFPLIVVVEAIWLVWCIHCARQLDQPMLNGINYWWLWLKEGIRLNVDFVENGL